MNCKITKQNSIAYLEGTLDTALSAQIETHLAECESCRRLFNEIRATYSVLDNETKPMVSDFFYTRVEVKLQKEKTEVSFQPRIMLRLMPVAASLLLLLAVGLGLMFGKSISKSGMFSNAQTSTTESVASYNYLTGSVDEGVDYLFETE